ncbi:MAG: exodeoxyribonuclease VII large subunit, partial [Thiobacillus sp.]|nr:exodeoxyribonuclease VII large subunit [Thiobacillus sp.]
RLDALRARLSSPAQRLRRERHALSELAARLRRAHEGGTARRNLTLDRLGASLAHLDPERVLARGYSLVRRADGTIVQDAAGLAPGDRLDLRFHRGRAQAEVITATKD